MFPDDRRMVEYMFIMLELRAFVASQSSGHRGYYQEDHGPFSMYFQEHFLPYSDEAM